MVNRKSATAKRAPRKQPRIADVTLFGWSISEKRPLSISVVNEEMAVLDIDVTI